MVYYYVKNVNGTDTGTATGDAGRAATLRTGSFSNMGVSAYYKNIYDVFNGVPTTAPVSGDVVIVSDLHDHRYSANTILGCSVEIISVDDANADVYKVGASEITTGGNYNLNINGGPVGNVTAMCGITLTASNDLTIFAGEAQKLTIIDGTVGLTGASGFDNFTLGDKDGSLLVLLNTDITFGNAGQGIRAIRSHLHWFGGSLVGTATDYLIKTTSEGAAFKIVNVDMTALNTAVASVFTSTSSDIPIFSLERCLLSSGVLLTSGTIETRNGYIKGESLSIGSADAYHYLQYELYNGTISEETTIIKTGGSTYDGTNEFSLEIASNSNCSYYNPVEVPVSAFSLAAGGATNKLDFDGTTYTGTITFTVHLARNNGTLLQDDEFWLEIEHSDGASNALGVLADTKPAPFAAGNNLTDEAGGWEGLTGVEGTDNQVMSTSKTLTIGALADNIGPGPVRIKVCTAIDTSILSNIFIDCDPAFS